MKDVGSLVYIFCVTFLMYLLGYIVGIHKEVHIDQIKEAEKLCNDSNTSLKTINTQEEVVCVNGLSK